MTERELSALKAQAYDLLLPHIPTGVALLDSDLRYLSINQTLADFNGHSIEEHLGQTVWQMLPQLAPDIAPVIQQVLQTGVARLDFAVSAPTPAVPEQNSDWLCSYFPVAGPDGSISAVAVLAQNQTLVRQLELSQQQSQQRLRKVLDSLVAFVGILTPDGTLIDANSPPLQAAGIQLEDVVQQKVWDTFWFEHSESERQRLKDAVKAANEGKTSRFDITAKMKDQIMVLDFMLVPMYDDNGKLSYLIPSSIDISARTQSEAELRESELRFRRVFDSAADGLICVDQHGCITMLNPRSLEMFGYQAEELIGQPIEILVPEELTERHHQHRHHYLQKPSSRRMSERAELYAKRKDNSLFPVEIGLTHLNMTGDARVLATVTDITAQKAAQQKLQFIVDEKSQLLNERTTLLNEVHHRVKNNLQIISSLLNLQARGAMPELKQALTESQLRVRTMALTHQLLYEKRDFSSIALGSYLQQLCQLVRQSLSQHCQIMFDFSAVDQQLVLELEQAIPCGLFVNEVLTNAIKHAFPGRQTGLIRLELSLLEDGHIHLAIIDDGVGLSDKAELGKGSSLGFQLIPTFIAQLRGELQLQRSPGTGFRVRFLPVTEKLS
ncbi:PAS domain S-box protein [Rheinheimera sp. 4Y26]|uniref:PAS domain S-box protein n=1 Tax=Rheinheimera sp. 4Y26 TaxID=2977811 RepID=UPI0021B0FF87|nr:PAS domain S-box protein [Rheinheimera sp. 4Y26]MCT6701343.1 PAS domain S-box protein [Rheinheimera sp. 4Y26]